MGNFLKVVTDILSIPDLRKRLFITFGILAVYRIGYWVYLPGVNIDILEEFIKRQEESAGGFWYMIRMTGLLTGGDLSNATIFSLGIMPYISASIIFSLLVKVFPKLEALQKEGESGRRQINRYTRYFTVILCLIQGMFIYNWLTQTQTMGGNAASISEGGFLLGTLQVLVLTAGTLFLMWLGEKITEFGIGNGTSLIIMAGILATMPGAVIDLVLRAARADADERAFAVLKFLILGGLFMVIIGAVVYITRGQRRIPIQQVRTVKGRRAAGANRSYMPIRVNSAGVLPIIFAQSLILIPALLLGFVLGEGNVLSRMIGYNGFLYPILYSGMIFFFTYFWTTLMFNPVEIAENMKEHGSFVPGIRPGKRTAEYLQQIINRVTLAGATFLTIIALIPRLVGGAFQVDSYVTHFLGGTGILIVVGVALDLVDKVESQLLVRQYEGFIRTSDDKGKVGNR